MENEDILTIEDAGAGTKEEDKGIYLIKTLPDITAVSSIIQQESCTLAKSWPESLGILTLLYLTMAKGQKYPFIFQCGTIILLFSYKYFGKRHLLVINRLHNYSRIVPSALTSK